MNLDIKNIIIIILFFYLISGNIFKIVTGLSEGAIYLVLFFMVISKISPDLYNKLGNSFNLKRIEYHNVIDLLSNLFNKAINCVPIVKELISKN